MKVSLHSQRECTRKIQQLEEKLKKAQRKNSNYSKQNRYLKKRVKVLLESRENWKAKNRSKAKVVKELSKAVKKGDRIKRHHYDSLIILLCVQFRVHANCTYRGIKKILLVLQSCSVMNLSRVPCANTIENWVSKMGYYQLENQALSWQGKEVCIIVDERITKGNDRVLLIICTALEKENQSALSRKDVQVCYLGSRTNWNGATIKEEIEKIILTTGMKVKLFLSDEDNKLKKAARLLGCPHLPDISHAIGTCLRNVFEKDTDYRKFREQIVGYKCKGVCSAISYLHPPRQRTKARFMNQKPVIQWALTILKKYSHLNKEEQDFYKDLAKHSSFLKVFNSCVEIGQQLALLLKTKGLCESTLLEAEQIIANIKTEEDRMEAFIVRVKKYLLIYKKYLQDHKGVFNSCSDIIESIFGQHKRMEATNTMVGITQLDLELCLYCLQNKDINKTIKPSLESVFMTDIYNWKKEHSHDNQLVKRRNFFN